MIAPGENNYEKQSKISLRLAEVFSDTQSDILPSLGKIFYDTQSEISPRLGKVFSDTQFDILPSLGKLFMTHDPKYDRAWGKYLWKTIRNITAPVGSI
jgi:hypothetical protein